MVFSKGVPLQRGGPSLWAPARGGARARRAGGSEVTVERALEDGRPVVVLPDTNDAAADIKHVCFPDGYVPKDEKERSQTPFIEQSMSVAQAILHASSKSAVFLRKCVVRYTKRLPPYETPCEYH